MRTSRFGKNLADRANAVIDGRVDGDHRRSFGEAVAFVNADADGGEPFGKFAAQGRASRNESFDSAAHTGADFREDEFVGELPDWERWEFFLREFRACGRGRLRGPSGR